MKITKISMFHYDWISSTDEQIKFAKNRTIDAIPGRVMKIETDEGITGWSEITPYGNNYLDMFTDAIVPGTNLIAPSMIGRDPRNIEENYYHMDRILMGHPYIKSAFDNACWDILAKSVDKPVYELIGGKQHEEVIIMAFLYKDYELYHEKLLEQIRCFRAAGCTRYQTKAANGTEGAIAYLEYIKDHLLPSESMWFDGNRGFTVSQALKICNAAKTLGVGLTFEQPCETAEQCLKVQEMSGIPVIVDECVMNINDLVSLGTKGIAGLSIKVGRVGGLTKAKLLRDYCVAAGIEVDIQSVCGSTIADSVITHLATSTPQGTLGFVYSGQVCTDVRLAPDGSQPTCSSAFPTEDWKMRASDKPGFGVTPDESVMTLLKTWE